MYLTFWKQTKKDFYIVQLCVPPYVVLIEGEDSLKFILDSYWLTAVATTDELSPAMFFNVDSDQFIVRSVLLLYSSTG